MHLRSLIISAAMLLVSVSHNAYAEQAGNLHIDRAYARATMPGQTSGGAYVTIENKGKDADRLISASSPAAKSVEIHTMSMDGNVMRMREVPHIDITPGAKITMKPGDGYHIMLIGIKQPLKAGDKVPLTLTFEKSGKVDVEVLVAQKDPKATKEKMMHHNH
jgi:periplasmic copper chaperone A